MKYCCMYDFVDFCCCNKFNYLKYLKLFFLCKEISLFWRFIDFGKLLFMYVNFFFFYLFLCKLLFLNYFYYVGLKYNYVVFFIYIYCWLFL